MSCAGTKSDAIIDSTSTVGYVSCTAATDKADIKTATWVLASTITNVKCVVGSAANTATATSAV